MTRKMTTSLARRAGRTYEHLRSKLVTGAFRAQLGPTREGDVRDYVPARAWQHHRS